ncbi:MAG: hypothetical protein IT168_13680 [Bryobacterales bacterium]|nr:hypothetical protein [Bryobacterales bacterium]
MVYRRRRSRSTASTGFLRFENLQKRSLTGFISGEYVRLKDEFGNVWQGSADAEDEQTVRYRFRDSEGRTISGISDRFGIILRDERGNSWRGFLC